MVSKVRVVLLWLIIGIIIFLLSTTSPMAQQTGLLGFQLMHEDPLYDNTPLEKDLNKLWMYDTNDHLYFLVQFANVSYENPVSTNITIAKSTDPGEKYLVSAKYYNGTYTLYIAHSLSLTGDAVIPEGDSYFIQYIEKRIFYHEAEIGFYVDWDDLGGQEEINVVAWSNRSIYPNFDKLPDASSLTYNGVQQSDREIDFNAALNGDFSSLFVPELITTTLDTSKNEVQTTHPVSTTSSSPALPTVLAIIYIMVLITFVGIWMVQRSKSSKQDELPKKMKTPKPPPSQQHTTPQDPQDVEMKYIPELGREVRMCCYQTARLDETYCWCGRGVSDDLRNLF